MKTHKHRTAKRSNPYGYNCCVAGIDCVPGSHGGVTYLETCSCGAARRVNSNGRYVEREPWPEVSR